MKKIRSFILILLITVSISVYAYSALPLVVDNLGVLTTEEAELLNNKADEIRDSYGIDTAVYITDSFNGEYAGEYADSFYLSSGYSDDCSILLIAVKDREYYLYNCGKASKAITDYGSYYIDDRIIPYLSQNDWYKAAKSYLDYNSKFYKEYYKTGQAYDYNNTRTEPGTIIIYSCGCLLAGFLISGAMLSKKKKELNSIIPVSDADKYADFQTFYLRQNTDQFITKNISRVPIPKYDNRGPGGGSGGYHGGTTMHTGSSGHSYSGHGGHF